MGCLSRIDDTIDNFVLTNLSEEALGDAKNNTKPLYGGIGNKFRIEFTLGLTGAKKDIRIEPVGVIVIGIDGLRQDVLYPDKVDGNNFENVNEGNYYIDASTLSGLGQILKGNPTDSKTQQYIMLPEVTAVFPSITLASWASIFTGEMPGKTGILGNEFFARDLYNPLTLNNQAIPGMGKLPSGMVTLSDGAFYNGSIRYFVNNLIPAHDYAKSTEDKLDKSSPNKTLNAAAQTIYKWIKEQAALNNSYDVSNVQTCKDGASECRSAVFFNHYAGGADWWGTIDLAWWQTLGINLGVEEFFADILGSPESASSTLDETPAKEALDFLTKYYPKDSSGSIDKKKRFPALFTIYYGGPDHYAHDAGMNAASGSYTGYKDYFQRKTDAEIKKVVDKLIELDEFYNKLFIITADHGMTEMPDTSQMTYTQTKRDEDGNIISQKTWYGDASCKLKLEGFNKDKVLYPELANNNLHIWEMGEYLKTVGEFVEQTTTQAVENKILAPKEIAKLFTDPSTGQPLKNGAAEKEENANIIAALNGPMAHVYVKGSDWSAAPDVNRVLEVAEIFRVTLQGARGGDSPLPIFPAGTAVRLGYKIGVLSNSIDEILVRDGGVYKVYTVENASVSLKGINSLSSEYVDAVNRIEKMNNVKRSGDIVLIMKDSTSGSALDRYTTGVSCKSWHGSLNRSDSYVPFIFAYPGGNKTEIETILKKDTVCKSNYSDCKGNWKLSDAIKEIIKVQYQ